MRGNHTRSNDVRVVPITPQLITTEHAAGHPTSRRRCSTIDRTPTGPGDTLYITVWKPPELTSPAGMQFASTAGITRWNRFLSQLLPITSAIDSTAAAGYYIQHNNP